jgi:hypothetical protein
VTTHVQADRDLTPSFVLRWLIVAVAAGVVRPLLTGWRSGATHPAVFVTFGRAPFSAAITIVLADVAVLAVVVA